MRGRQIAMVFQEPMTSLNPLLTVGWQIAEVLEEHLGLGRRAALARAVELFRDVGIPDPGSASTTIRISSRAACASA